MKLVQKRFDMIGEKARCFLQAGKFGESLMLPIAKTASASAMDASTSSLVDPLVRIAIPTSAGGGQGGGDLSESA